MTGEARPPQSYQVELAFFIISVCRDPQGHGPIPRTAWRDRKHPMDPGSSQRFISLDASSAVGRLDGVKNPRLLSGPNSQHSLLSIAGGRTKTNSETRVSETNISRDSISMPPPAPRTSFARPFTSFDDLAMDESRQPRKDASSPIPCESDNVLQPSAKDNRLSSESNSLQHLAKQARHGSDLDANRLSFSSLFSMGSAIYNGGPTSIPNPSSGASSIAGSVKSSQLDAQNASAMPATPMSPSTGTTRIDASSGATTATDAVSVTASHSSQGSQHTSATRNIAQSTIASSSNQPETWDSGSLPRLQNTAPDRRSRSRTQRRPSGSVVGASSSPTSK